MPFLSRKKPPGSMKRQLFHTITFSKFITYLIDIFKKLSNDIIGTIFAMYIPTKMCNQTGSQTMIGTTKVRTSRESASRSGNSPARMVKNNLLQSDSGLRLTRSEGFLNGTHDIFDILCTHSRADQNGEHSSWGKSR